MTTEGEMVPGDLPSKGNGDARGGTGGDRVPASTQSSGGRHTQASDVILRRLVMGIADGVVTADDTQAFEVNDMRVGLFKDAETAATPAAVAAG